MGGGGDDLTEAAGGDTAGSERQQNKTRAVGVDLGFPEGKVITAVPQGRGRLSEAG